MGHLDDVLPAENRREDSRVSRASIVNSAPTNGRLENAKNVI